jgi:tripartite-type tricarboxylate transporter receptor subunit TctC
LPHRVHKQPPALQQKFGAKGQTYGPDPDIIKKLNEAAVEALADPAVRSRIVEFGAEIYPRDQQTPEGLGALRKADAEKWWPIIKELGIRAE